MDPYTAMIRTNPAIQLYDYLRRLLYTQSEAKLDERLRSDRAYRASKRLERFINERSKQ